jgi:hypothetical protein
MASRMLERSVQARAALDRHDPALARHLVMEALENITAMELQRPKAPQPFLVTLYTETVRIAVEQPQPVGHSGAQGSANRQQEAPVAQVTGESTRVAVDVTDAKKRLTTARDAIDRNDLKTAAQSLAAIDSDLKAESALGDLPLVQARENLQLALDDLRGQKPADAAAPLRLAAQALGQYANSGSRYASDAAKLRPDLESLAGSISQDAKGADARIAAWSREIGGWIQPLTPPPIKK